MRGATPRCRLRYRKEPTDASSASTETHEAGGDPTQSVKENAITSKLIAPHKAAPQSSDGCCKEHKPQYGTACYLVPPLQKGKYAKRALYDLAFNTTKLVRHKHKDETGILNYSECEQDLLRYMLGSGYSEKTFGSDWGWGSQYRLVLKLAYAGAKTRFEIEVFLPEGKGKQLRAF